MTALLRDLAVLTARPIAVRTPSRSLAYLTLIALGFVPAISREWARVIPFDRDVHASFSLDIAVNRAVCGRLSDLSVNHDIASALVGNAGLVDRPLRTLAADEAGSVKAYCGSVTNRFLNNENSLMLLERWILAVFPNASVRNLGQALLALKIAMILVFVLGLLLLDAPLVPCAVLLACAVSIVESLDRLHYSAYP